MCRRSDSVSLAVPHPFDTHTLKFVLKIVCLQKMNVVTLMTNSLTGVGNFIWIDGPNFHFKIFRGQESRLKDVNSKNRQVINNLISFTENVTALATIEYSKRTLFI